jgi:exopolysaccharide biosynthesis WecB/TagA/CpsF family protein
VVVASSEEVAKRLNSEHPNLRCVLPPMFDIDDADAVNGVVDEIVAATSAIGARFVVVGLSMSKSHLIARHLRERWVGDSAPPTVLLLGAAPELYLGLQRRAPAWMQRAGVEWVYRLVKDPRRLAKRYLVDDVRFLPLVWREWRQTRR